ncbi:MAG: DUF4124 domain-containing protein [Betaproteobacteria bacterium]
MAALAVLALAAMATTARGQVYKCTDDSGRTTYADAPCDASASRLTLPRDAKGAATDPSMCAQLLDETRRLAAEVRRNAERGRGESAQGRKRRQALDAQYASRCVGIARSAPSSR